MKKNQINIRKNNIFFVSEKKRKIETFEIKEKERKIESEKLKKWGKQLRNKRKRTKYQKNKVIKRKSKMVFCCFFKIRIFEKERTA